MRAAAAAARSGGRRLQQHRVGRRPRRGLKAEFSDPQIRPSGGGGEKDVKSGGNAGHAERIKSGRGGENKKEREGRRIEKQPRRGEAGRRGGEGLGPLGLRLGPCMPSEPGATTWSTSGTPRGRHAAYDAHVARQGRGRAHLLHAGWGRGPFRAVPPPCATRLQREVWLQRGSSAEVWLQPGTSPLTAPPSRHCHGSSLAAARNHSRAAPPHPGPRPLPPRRGPRSSKKPGNVPLRPERPT